MTIAEQPVAFASEPMQTMGIQDYIAGFRRRRKSILLTFGCLFVVVLLTALLWPASYKTSATILIEEQEIPEDMVRSTVTSFATQQIEVIRARVLTLENIMQLVRKNQLYDDKELASMPRTEVLEEFIDSVSLDLLNSQVVDPRSGRPMEATIAFTLSFEADDPAKSLKITNELTSLFLNENLRNRTEKTSSTAEFLRGEVEKSSDEMRNLEAELAQFKTANQAALPEVYRLNMQNMVRYQTQLVGLESRNQELIKREGDLVARLATTNKYSPVVLPTGEAVLGDVDRLKALQSEYSRVAARYSLTHPDVVRLQREIDSLLASTGGAGNRDELLRLLESRQSELNALEAKYADTYPDVVAQRKIVEQLQRQIESMDDVGAAPPPDNPAYLMLDNQLQTVRIEKGSLDEQISQLEEQIDSLSVAAVNAPVIERQYTNMVRNLELISAKNLELRAKLKEAELAGELEAGRKGQRFTMVEPPIMPEEPSSPNRPAILVLGIVFAAGAGIGVGLLLEAMDGSIRSPQQLSQLMGVAPLVTIPYINSPEETAAADPQRKRYWLLGGGVAGTLVVLLALHFFVRPLDVMWYEILGKL
ncbi:GumC family protein [Haliea sp. E17]|uniref:GumC family protein n=1 Tax=Haliea sp. E17 TaxID=3401576 RepID=UPI003AADA446